MEAAAISWDRELARTLAREGPAAPGWPSRWRPGMMPGSRAALGLWERAGGLDGDEDGDDDTGGAGARADDGDVSPRGNVDTAQEVSEGYIGWVASIGAFPAGVMWTPRPRGEGGKDGLHPWVRLPRA